MFKMGSYDSFEYLQHKLWLKEKSGIKMSIWFPTIKSWELPWITCVQVTCHISLENFWLKLQVCFKPHFNQRFAQEITGLQSGESSNFKNFKTFDLGVLRKMTFGCKPYG
jgi:hypothetical protein